MPSFVIRGNASEILALAGDTETTKGVDSTASSTGAVQAAWKLAHEADCIVSLSGETDYITDGKSIMLLKTDLRLCLRSPVWDVLHPPSQGHSWP